MNICSILEVPGLEITLVPRGSLWPSEPFHTADQIQIMRAKETKVSAALSLVSHSLQNSEGRQSTCKDQSCYRPSISLS